MATQDEPFQRTANGDFAVQLSDHERELLAELPRELMKLLTNEGGDQSIFRLFPRVYENDLVRQVEYDGLMRDDLERKHIEALEALEATSNATSVTLEQLDNWARAVNLLRLVLGTRLDIDEDTTADDFPPGSPVAGAFALYAYLGDLQEEMVDALSSALP